MAGCIGGGLLGLFGGGLTLVILAICLSLFRPDPVLEATPPDRPDLRATIGENFLNRYIEQPAEGSVSVDILPNNQIEIIADTLIPGFGSTTPVQITGRFEVQLAGQALTARLLDTQVQGLDLPPELIDIFGSDVPLINQNLQTMVDQISQRLGVAVTFTGLHMDENQIQIELREAQ